MRTRVHDLPFNLFLIFISLHPECVIPTNFVLCDDSTGIWLRQKYSYSVDGTFSRQPIDEFATFAIHSLLAKFVACLGFKRSIQFSIVSLCGIFVSSTHRTEIGKRLLRVGKEKSVLYPYSLLQTSHSACSARAMRMFRWTDRRETEKSDAQIFYLKFIVFRFGFSIDFKWNSSDGARECLWMLDDWCSFKLRSLLNDTRLRKNHRNRKLYRESKLVTISDSLRTCTINVLVDVVNSRRIERACVSASGRNSFID